MAKSIKVVLIVKCEKCESNHVYDGYLSKHDTLQSQIVAKTNLEQINAFGTTMIICRTCANLYDELTENRKKTVEEFVGDLK